MANAILDAVWGNLPFFRLPPREALLLAYLADRADWRTRESWYSQREIAQTLNCSVKTVYNALERLRRGGYLEQVVCNGEACKGHPHRKTPHYRVAIMQGERKYTPPPGKPGRKPKPTPETSSVSAMTPALPRKPGRPRKQVYSYGTSSSQNAPSQNEPAQAQEPVYA